MAKIIFFTERLPPDTDPITNFSYELMRSLADQYHEIKILTTYRGPLDKSGVLSPNHSRIEILRPFQRWNWFEIPRLLPLVAGFRPEILHFIQPRAESLDGLTNAMNALAALAPLVGHPAVVTSLFDFRGTREFERHRMLLLTSDAITTANEAQAKAVKTFLATHGKRHATTKSVEIVPTITPACSTPEAPPPPDDFASETLRGFFTTYDKIVFVPGDLDWCEDPGALLEVLIRLMRQRPGLGVVIGGGWGRVQPLLRRQLLAKVEDEGLGARVLLAGGLHPASERTCLHRATVVFVAALAPESLFLAQYLRTSLAAAGTLVMEARQAELDPLPWQDRVHAFIAANRSDWESTLSEALEADDLRDRIQRANQDFHRESVLDHPANLMSRLYSRTLTIRSNRS